jgi:hypothetical protein
MRSQAEVWKMSSYPIPLLVTSLNEVFIETMEYEDTFHTFSHCDLTVWSIYWGEIFHTVTSQCETVWKVSSYSITSINNSYNKVTIRKGMKGVITLHPLNTFHTFSHCDLTVWSIYWGDGVRWNLSHLFSLWPHCMKYLLRWLSMMTPINAKRYERCHRTPSSQ